MTAYGKELNASQVVVIYRGRECPLLGSTCLHCDYDFFVPGLPEHDPSYCPNCGMKFRGVTLGEPANRQ